MHTDSVLEILKHIVNKQAHIHFSESCMVECQYWIFLSQECYAIVKKQGHEANKSLFISHSIHL